MASLTIRKLDEAVKAELRLRAARNGRSVEDEVRVILRERAATAIRRGRRGQSSIPQRSNRATGIHSIRPMACATSP